MEMTINFEKHYSFCWYCQVKLISPLPSPKIKKKINQQTFTFFPCWKCDNYLYFWATSAQTFFFQPKIHIVLLAPEIAGNVGTIIRLAAAFGFQLHLIEPFGFIFSERWLKRSSTNHFPFARIKTYSDWATFQLKNKKADCFFTSARAKKSLTEIDFTLVEAPIYLVFGCESKGLPLELKKQHWEKTVSLKQTNLVSSINLANAVSIFSYHLFAQYNFLNLI